MSLPTDRDPACPFCQLLDTGELEPDHPLAPAVGITPLNPVTDGHRLFLPVWHARHTDPTEDGLTAAVRAAASWARSQGKPFNLITSSGAEATQTVEHIHVHYVPRAADDGLPLPWTPQQSPAWAAARDVLARADKDDQAPEWWDALRGIVNG